MVNDLSCGRRILAQVSFVLLSPRDWQTERQRDRKALQFRALHYMHYMQSHGKKHVRKPFVTPRIWAVVEQKTIFWPNLGCALRRAVCRCRSCIHIEAGKGSCCNAMTQHYPIPVVLLLYGREGHLFLCYTYSILPESASSKTLLFVFCWLQTRDKECCGSSRWLNNLQPCYDNVSLMCPNDHSDSMKALCHRIDTVISCVCTAVLL